MNQIAAGLLMIVTISAPHLTRAKVSEPVYVAVLSFPASSSQAQTAPLVRVGFQKTESWGVADPIPAKLKWTVTRNGKSLGKLESRLVTGEAISQERSHRISTKLSKRLKLPNPSQVFITWMGSDRHRPLVVTTGRVEDPDRWTIASEGVELNGGRLEFLKTNNTVPICDSETGKLQEQRQITSDMVKLVGAYKGKSGDLLIGLQLADQSDACDGPEPEQLSPHWYLVSGKTVTFIGNRMVPVDAGDYDSDGQSEWIFQIARYNEDGYALLPLATKKLLEFTWGYH